MRERNLTVYIEGKPERYPEGTLFQEIAARHQKDYSWPIVLVSVEMPPRIARRQDGSSMEIRIAKDEPVETPPRCAESEPVYIRLRELSKCAENGERIRFLTVRDKAGRDTYRRSLVLLMLKSIYHTVGDNRRIDRVSVHFSVGDSYYCTMQGRVPLTEDFLERVKDYMWELVRAAAPIHKSTISTWEACRRFHEYRMYDKEELFRYRRSSKVNIYNIEGFEDYYYGYMVPDASYLTCFDLRLFEDGFVLCFPSQMETLPRRARRQDGSPMKIRCAKGEPMETLPRCAKDEPVDTGELFEIKPQFKIWREQREALRWSGSLGIPTVGALNTYIVNHRAKDLIMIQEAYHEKKIAEMAAKIAASGKKRVVLIAGPSSSGKTTFSHRLSTQLSVLGLKPHPIEADNYFVERERTPVDEDGKPNFECLEAIDVEKLNEDMLALLRGETVELPTFNFKTGKREYKGNYKTLGAQDILIIEGIHCLNDKLTYRLSADEKVKIYISALTQLNIDEHNRIPTTDGRLLRRMVRDARVRGTDARGTIGMWPSVRRGEESYIFPFQESADYIFNSTLIYELAVLKQYAEPLLFSIHPEEPEYEEAKRLLKFLDYFLPVPGDDIPNNSLIREFIGGSCFEK
ncbi:MAG: nucleoside kinase [Lachnospiraceae bacterium]|nr:nucleoside kinase [Lachnospiraceae bacterium]